MTREDAIELCESYGIDDTLDDEEEVRLLREQNPALLRAMESLSKIAHQPREKETGGECRLG